MPGRQVDYTHASLAVEEGGAATVNVVASLRVDGTVAFVVDTGSDGHVIHYCILVLIAAALGAQAAADAAENVEANADGKDSDELLGLISLVVPDRISEKLFRDVGATHRLENR